MIGRTNSRATGIVLAATTALALAAGALAGCAGSGPESKADTDEAQEDALFSFFGNSPLYGHSPKLGPDQKDAGRKLPFKPAYDAVLYLQFRDGAGVAARHAFFQTVVDFPGADQAAKDEYEKKRLRCAIAFLEPKLADPSIKCSDYLSDANAPTIFSNFEHFEFGSPQRLYVFVDNGDVIFNDIYPIAFTPFGALREPTAGVKWPKNKNYSFYDQRFVGDVIGNFDALVLNNYFMGNDGKELKDKKNDSFYSLNINLLACPTGAPCDLTKKDKLIPLVIDPDTNNGVGNEP